MNDRLLTYLAETLARPQVEWLGRSLLHFLWQGAAIGLLTMLILRANRRAKPATRYQIAAVSLSLMAASPLMTFAWYAGRGADDAEISGASSFVTDAHAKNETRTEPTSGQRALVMDENSNSPSLGNESWASISPQTSPPTRAMTPIEPQDSAKASSVALSRRWLPVGVGIWFLGVALLSSRLCAGWLRLQCVRWRGARPLTGAAAATARMVAERMGVRRVVGLWESATWESPAVIGWLKPVILMPTSALLGLSPRQLESILAHELAHVRRRDYLVNLLQTAVETLLFYHPAVWWVSRVMRLEREACCDEIAVQVVGDRLGYARALETLESSRGATPQWVMAATGAPLADRIRRLLGMPSQRNQRSGAWAMVFGFWIALGCIALLKGGDVLASDPNDDPSRSSTANEGNSKRTGDEVKKSDTANALEGDTNEWGPESNGVRARLVVVPPSLDDEAPDLSRATDEFESEDDVTFAVELKNVSDKPQTLLGIRYGESFATAVGKLNGRFFAPYLFDLEFTDEEGKPLTRPGRALSGGLLELSGASAHVIEPSKSLVIPLRPTKFMPPMAYRFPAGAYRARVRYHGPTTKTLEAIRKHWPDSPQGKAWSGDAGSNQVSFRVGGGGSSEKESGLAWGEETNGLQAAVEFRLSTPEKSPVRLASFPLDSKIEVVFHVKNVSDQPISFSSESWRQGDRLVVKDGAGADVQVQSTWYSGLPILVEWTLNPGQVAELEAAAIGAVSDKANLEKFSHPVGESIVVKTGLYKVIYTLRMGGVEERDPKTGVATASPRDWKGELKTGEATLNFRARTAADDERERPRTFLGKLQFMSTDGQIIDKGIFSIRDPSSRSQPSLHPIGGATTEIADCIEGPVSITARAPGYEEATFHEVTLRPKEIKRIELQPAAPTRFRLISKRDRSPIVGAKVRFFNKTAGKAAAGPYPMDGIEGPVYAISGSDGVVTLDSLQRIDPYYANLGDAIYYFYVEPPDTDTSLAPRFVGMVKAGADLGEIEMGPWLEVKGRVEGTKEELDRLAAEWDQPFELVSDNAEANWLYAVSKPLEFERNGDAVTFHLKGLAPGKLRIIADFSPTPHHVSHSYTRRDPNPTDTVLEVELTESLDNLILRPKPIEKSGAGK